MNKKIIGVISLLVIIILSIIIYFVYKDNQTISNNENSNENNQEEKEKENMNENSKIGIVYFSATGTTKQVAEYLQEQTKGTLIEIVPTEKYSDEDLNYHNNECRANKEQNDEKARPQIENKIDVDNFDIIYLGYPIWWGDAPKIILTFLDTYNLNGKTVIPFCTSGSTGIETSLNTLKNYNKEINWKNGKRLTPSKRDEIEEFVKEH